MNRPLSTTRSAAVGRHLLVALAGFACTVPALADISIPNVPLQTGTAIPPNLMVTFDDSGSMTFRHLYINKTDNSSPEIDGHFITSTTTDRDDNYNDKCSSVYGTLTDNCIPPDAEYYPPAAAASYHGKYMVDQSYTTNGLYYDPTVVYSRWSYPDGTQLSATDAATWNAACNDHNLVTYTWAATTSGGAGAFSTSCPANQTVDLGGTVPAIGGAHPVPAHDRIITFYSPKDFTKSTDQSYIFTADNYYRFQFRKGSDGATHLYRSYLDTSAATTESGTDVGCNDAASGGWGWRNCTKVGELTNDAPGGRTLAQEESNFANWFSYYQSRVKTAKAGLTATFSTLGGLNPRVGFWPINSGSDPIVFIPVASADGGLFEDRTVDPITGTSSVVTNKTDWFKKIVQLTIGQVGTPLRTALKNTGEYFSDNTSGHNGKTDGPYASKDLLTAAQIAGATGNEVSCRSNFTILTTDGYWNAGGDDPGTISPNDDGAGFPFQDTTLSNSLADVAWKYWKTDLTGLTNNVPKTPADQADWQHMVTFSISIGARGTLDPVAVLNYINTHATGPFASPLASWPKAVGDTLTTIDDLFHASINGHGSFVVASDPTTLKSALKSALDAILARTGSGANVAINSNQIAAGTDVYQTSFVAGQWNGDVVAYPIDATTGAVGTTPVWKASDAGNLLTYANRALNAWTFDTATGKGAAFPTAAQLASIGTNGAEKVAYVLGKRGKEVQNGGNMRNRKSVPTDSATNTESMLGDVIDSSPAYVQGDAAASVPNMLYVGANDGMLHAFNADTGKELFDYLPAGESDVSELTKTTYEHMFFVDGSIVVSTKEQTKNTTDQSGAVDSTGKNILVGVLGRGGNTVYALDVSDPAHFDANKVLWEYSTPHLGKSLGTPIIAKLNVKDGNGKNIVGVILGNGYNSSTGHSEVFILNIRTGELVAELDSGVGNTTTLSNGMSTPKGWDADRDGTVDQIFAGDLQGHLWEFDVSTPATTIPVSSTVWKIAPYLSGNPLFTAIDSSGNPQPITSGVSIGLNPADFSRWIFFGTGRLLVGADIDLSQSVSKSVQSWYGIKEGTAAITMTTATRNTVLKQRKIVAYSADKRVRAFETGTPGDMAGFQGWYVDLLDYSVATPAAQGERIITDTVLLGKVLLSSSILPLTTDPCSPPTGFINAISPFTGTALSSEFFDTNGSGGVDGSDVITSGATSYVPGSIDLGVNMPSLSSFLQHLPLAGLVVGGSNGSVGSVIVSNPTNSGRISWREILIGN